MNFETFIENFNFYCEVKELLEEHEQLVKEMKRLQQHKYHKTEKGRTKMQKNNHKRRFKRVFRELLELNSRQQ